MKVVVALLLVASVVIIVAWLLGPILNWTPIDFCRLYTASRMILAGRSPYGELPFFAPPWLSFLLSPLLLLPSSSAALGWILISVVLTLVNVGLLGTLADIPRRKSLLIGSLSALLP